MRCLKFQKLLNAGLAVPKAWVSYIALTWHLYCVSEGLCWSQGTDLYSDADAGKDKGQEKGGDRA